MDSDVVWLLDSYFQQLAYGWGASLIITSGLLYLGKLYLLLDNPLFTTHQLSLQEIGSIQPKEV